MAKKDLTYSDSAGSAVGKINDNFGELATGTSVTPATVTKDVKASSFCTAVNNVMTALRTAFGMSSSLHPIADTNTAKQVVDNINTDITNLYAAQSSGGGDDPTPVPDEKIKVLFFGNSFTANSVFYLPFILLNNGITKFKVAFMFAAGASLEDYVGWYSSNPITTHIFDGENDTVWPSSVSKRPDVNVASDDWDLIVLQQASQASVDLSTYSPYTAQLMSLISGTMASANPSHQYKIGWNVTHARMAVAYNNPLAILSNIQSTCQSNSISVILPYGTAIYNALTKKTMRTIGSGSYRNFKHSDGTHLSPGLAMYAASLAIAQALSDEFSLGFDADDDTTAPIEGWSDSSSENYKGISPTYGSFNEISNESRAIVKAAVAAAIQSKFAITQLDGEMLSVQYNLTGCSIIGTAPTSVAYGQTISFRIVADTGKTMSSVTWKLDWRGATTSYTLGENGEFEKVVTDNLIITATAT